MPAIVGAVLCGGSSRRMGRDKALVEVDGVPMASRVARALRDGGCRPVVGVGGAAARGTVAGMAGLADRWPGEGPLGGVITVLADAGAPAVVAACDLPGLDAATVRRLAAALNDGADVVLAVTDRDHYTCAAWSPSARVPLEECFAAGERSLRGAVAALSIARVEVARDVVRNINMPDDTALALPPVTVREISVVELAAEWAKGARVVDVREPAEYAEGHVPGAPLVALGTVPQHVDDFRGDGTTYVICRSGARSRRACEYLIEAGLVDVVNVAGGTLAWVAGGYPVAVGDLFS